jgi:hypothetical protein
MTLALSPLLQRFAERTPLPVMVRGILERCLNPAQLDAWFERVAQRQYTRTLLFSTVFDLLTQVVCRQLRIPRESCHRFHRKPATLSTRRLPLIPRQACHPRHGVSERVSGAG